MADSSAVPGYDTTRATRGNPDRAGTRAEPGPQFVTSEPGQYPPNAPYDQQIFGGPLPDGTGAPGSAGGTAPPDPTNLAGQEVDSFTGLSHADINSTGAPGTTGSALPAGNGPDSIEFTRPGSYQSGSYAQDTVRDTVTGPGEWTEANESGYATGGPQLPGIAGNEPVAGSDRYQPGGGRVLRGGRAVRG
jgi:hypothetical protein